MTKKNSRPETTKLAKTKIKSMSHDALFRKIMSQKQAAIDFLECYLPKELKKLVDISSVERIKDSFVEDSLKRRMSDIIYSIKPKQTKAKDGSENQKIFAIVILEHQSTVDKFIAFRLWKYAILLMERYLKGSNKLPIIVPIVFYQGTKKYNAETNLWKLFEHPDLAKKLLIEDHLLINLREKTDQEALGQNHIGIMEYFMKHARCKDTVKLWEDFFNNVPYNVKDNKELIDIYIKPLLSYTEVKLEESKINDLAAVININLSGKPMATVADYFTYKGIKQGLEQGLEQGKLEGKKNTKEAAVNLLKQGINSDIVSSALKLSKSAVAQIKRDLFKKTS